MPPTISYALVWQGLTQSLHSLNKMQSGAPVPFCSQGEIRMSHTALSLLKKILHSLQQFSLYL